ncbi:unnamed protein product [Rotaria magnacalcarata]|uniref:Hemicentin-1-like von Willebrand factor A domain-containing protein n=1 Tax=Rotaria magnacalcarata TaxID=392030 RepID=A0A816YXW5_9BILA|nr:unnamed protein product [Rotaria magnacalcarata]
MSVFSDVVFPFNKFTRRRAALRGSSLYLSDLIKAMTSEWSYKKIFSLKLAGGKRDHALCLVLDITVSMFGNMVLFYLEKVTIITTHEHTFDSYAIYTLLRQIKFDQENDSKDTFDLGVAIDLLTNCATRRERKIFILTDGYGNCAGLLPMVQQHAEDLDIDLIVLGIGIDRKNLQLSYAQYIQYTGGSNVPKELRSLCENEPQFKSIDLLKQSEDFTTQAVTTEVESIINEITQLKLNFVTVGYSDIRDRPQYETLNFTHDEAQCIRFLDKLQARSGGDCPEDVPEALNKCFTLPNWSGSNVRFIVLITDAPGHEQDLNDDINDAYRNGTGLTVDKIIKRLLEKDRN